MPSGVAFLPSLAKGLRDRFGERLQDALILLPTRRAVRELGDAFVGESGASLLPRMRPLADIDPEEPPFEPGYLTGLVKPAMPGAQRRFELAQIIARYHAAITDLPLDPAGMLALADPLLSILDDAAMEEVSLKNLDKLKEIEVFAAQHFQNAATLYTIIQDYWPQHLEDQGLMEPMERRVALLNALTDLWSETPPDHPVIIAGSTGTLAATARLMRTVARMDDGLIILPGLDKSMPDTAWKDVGAEHPQNSLKKLISTIGIERGDIPDWSHIQGPPTGGLTPRRLIISESLVPVDATADWPARIENLRTRLDGEDIFEQALDGLSVIEASTDEEEALTCALIMRETLNTEGETAALVTPDPSLARRVKARLRRWGVEVDYSQGEPLEETSLGGFLAGVLRLAEDPLSPVDLAFLCKHSLAGLGREPHAAHREWLQLERTEFRGPRKKEHAELSLVKTINKALEPLFKATGRDGADAPTWARALTLTAETLASTDAHSGAERLWREDAGEKAASLIEDLMTYGDTLGQMNLTGFKRLFGTLMRGRVVRPRYGTHPRLQILGPLEARMLSADRIILGGLNEGIWPAGISAQPFLSRGMRQALNLSLPERRFGLAAHDFAELAANQTVFLTRSKRGDDGPKVASRWLWRLQTLARGAMGEAFSKALETNTPYLDWARQLDQMAPDKVKPAKPPKPTPPLEARWPDGRKMSITRFKTWVRDPYSIYARTILGLENLDDLDRGIGPAEYGTAIHNGLETFNKTHKGKIPAKAETRLSEYFEAELLEAGFDPHHLAKERIRLSQAASSVIDWMRERRANGWEYAGAEIWGEHKLDALNFTVYGKSDLFEKNAEGYAIIDFKTGGSATPAEVQAGFDPQLPLTAIILENDGFEGLKAGNAQQLFYMKVKGAGDNSEESFITLPEAKKGWTAEEYASETFDDVTKLIAAYDKPDTSYPSQPRLKYANDYGDYDDLARRGEWARLGNEGGGNE